MIHQDGRPVDIVAFVDDPLWRAYIATYSYGLSLCRRYVDGSRERFATLLQKQLTPAELERRASASSRPAR